MTDVTKTRDDVTRFFERRQQAWRDRDASALAAGHAEQGTVHSPMSGVVNGRDAIERLYHSWFRAFPDLEVRHEELLVDGDRAALYFTIRGTHEGEFMGLAGNGRRFETKGASFHELADGLIMIERRIYDFTGLLVQLGVLKAKPA